MKGDNNDMLGMVPMLMFDDQFSIEKWKKDLDKKDDKSNDILNRLRKGLSTDIKDDDFRLVLDIDDDFKRDYKEGTIKLEIAKNGEVYAQIKNKNRYGKKIPVQEELVEQNISVDELQLALQTEAIKEVLTNILEVMCEIDDKVEQVIKGQQNDRIGLFYSGMSLYVEAKNIEDYGLKKQVISQAIRSLSEAGSQMMQELREDIQYLVNKEYKKEKKQKIKVDERMNRIRKNFEIIYRSYFLRAMVYSECNEDKAMLMVLEEYGRFISHMIAPYATLLTECDPSDTLLVGGTWEKRAETLIACQNVKNALMMDRKVFYLIKED